MGSENFRILSMCGENFQISEHAEWYFKLLVHNQLFIHHVEYKLCFTTVNEGKYKLNFTLLRENYSALGFLRFPFGPGTDPLFPSSKGIESDFFMIPFGYGNKIMIP